MPNGNWYGAKISISNWITKNVIPIILHEHSKIFEIFYICLHFLINKYELPEKSGLGIFSSPWVLFTKKLLLQF